MKTRLLPMLALSATVIMPLQTASAEWMPRTQADLSLHLKDGSKLKASPVVKTLAVNPRLAGSINLQWGAIKQIDLGKGCDAAVFHFANGDRLTAQMITEFIEADTVLGRMKVPINSITKVDISLIGGPCHNIALGKPVHGQDGASHGRGLAKHVTDGDPTTHAKPPGSSFDYRIDLQNGTDASFGISRIVINWGRFGDQFVGIRQQGGEGWASAAWPGEYVTSYVVECRKVNQDGWEKVHEFNGRPVNEDAAGVVVVKRPTKEAGCSSESITCLEALDLKGVTQLRVRAKGGHWIGLFELEAYGFRE